MMHVQDTLHRIYWEMGSEDPADREVSALALLDLAEDMRGELFAGKVQAHAQEMMQKRGAHYASDSDRWKNFEAASKIAEATYDATDMARHASNFALKHLAYILTVAEGQPSTDEKLLESFADAYNYCLICDEILKGNK